jgi:hypothetical protein
MILMQTLAEWTVYGLKGLLVGVLKGENRKIQKAERRDAEFTEGGETGRAGG